MRLVFLACIHRVYPRMKDTRKVGRNPTCLVTVSSLAVARRPGFILVVDDAYLLASRARGILLNSPRWREAALRHVARRTGQRGLLRHTVVADLAEAAVQPFRSSDSGSVRGAQLTRLC